MPFFCKSCVLGLLCVAPTVLAAQNTVGEVFASDASVRGSVVFVGGGTQVLSGSQVAAGASSALLRLKRGGDIRICPGTDLSVATSPEGSSLMLSLSTGSIETNYRVNAVADTVLTPDFKMQMIGPGVFHLAIAANTKGDTCVRPLESNTASVIVSEMMGSGTYQVKPTEEIVFRGGKITGAQTSAMEGCGCPAPPPVQRAEEKPAPVTTPQPAPPGTVVQMDAPFVFRGEDSQPPEMDYSIASLKTRDTSSLPLRLQPTVIPPDDQLAQDVKKIEQAQARELQTGIQKQAEAKRAQEAARISAAQKAEQAIRDKETARQAEIAKKEQARRDKEMVRAADIAQKEQARQAAAAALATEKANREQAKRDKEAARQAEIAKAAQVKQEQASAKKQEILARKQQERDKKVAKVQEQKQQQLRAKELESARKEQAKQEAESKRQAELTRERETQAAKAEQKRAKEIQAAATTQSKTDQKTEPSVMKKIGSFFGRLFKS